MTVTQPLTDQQLDAIEARANAATKGPWTVELEQCDCSDGYCHHGTYVSAIYADDERRTEVGDFTGDDWRFAVNARTDMPVLLAALRDSRAEVEKLIRWHREDETALAEMRGTIEYQRAAQAARTAPEDTGAPLAAEHATEAPEPQETRESPAEALLRDAERYLSALHGSVARHDNLAANLGCAGCELRDKIRSALAADVTGE